jgi:hypothetical protein
VAKHALDENRDRREPKRPLLQIGQVDAGKKFDNVELPIPAIALPAPVIGVNVNFQIDVARLHSPIDERLASVVQTARHTELQSHTEIFPSCSSRLLGQK